MSRFHEQYGGITPVITILYGMLTFNSILPGTQGFGHVIILTPNNRLTNNKHKETTIAVTATNYILDKVDQIYAAATHQHSLATLRQQHIHNMLTSKIKFHNVAKSLKTLDG